MKKCFAVIAVLIAVLILCAGCQSNPAADEARVTHARIRYFDGSMDMLEVDRWYSVQPGIVTIHTKEGRTVCIGVNNVILIEETEEQYNH